VEEEYREAEAEFDVEKLEAYVIGEAERRGDRLYRIILSPRESTPFPRERIFVDLGRMETSFNVIRVSPDPDASPMDPRDGLPGRIVFFITTMLPFEKAASLVASRLDGTVDIAEIPFDSWEEESAHWGSEAFAAPQRRRDESKVDLALLVLSYKVLRYDMERILEAVIPGAGSDARGSMGRFESRLASYQATRVPFLCFEREGRPHIIPRFMVRGFVFTEDGKRIDSYYPDVQKPEGGIAEAGAKPRFAVIMGGAEHACDGTVGADRLVSYRELALSDIAITGRVSKDLFEVEIAGEKAYLVLPDFKTLA
jgi:hypothetical protein